MTGKLVRLWQRFVDYSFVGVSTFLLDLGLIYLLSKFTLLSEAIIIGAAFGIAVSINFLISYHIVFRGTTRDHLTGYLNFVAVALIGMQIIILGTQILQTHLELNLYAARILMSGLVGFGNFSFNTFINFKMFR